MAEFPWVKSYPQGVSWDLDIPKQALHEAFEEACAKYGDRPLTDFLDKITTFKDYKEMSDRAAAGFEKLGVKPGVHVGLFLPNTPHYVIAFFGVMKAGGVVVNYSPLDALPTLHLKVEDSETDILVTLDLASLAPQAEKLLGSTRLKTLVVGEFAEMTQAPATVGAQMKAAGMLAEVKRDGAHVPFKDLIANGGRYRAHP